MYVCDAIGFWAKNAAKFLADQRLYPPPAEDQARLLNV